VNLNTADIANFPLHLLKPVCGTNITSKRSGKEKRLTNTLLSHGFDASWVFCSFQSGVRISARPGSMAIACNATSTASNQSASPKAEFLARVSRIIEKAVIPVGVIILWRAAALPVEGI